MSSFDKFEASLDKLDEYIQSVEEYFFSGLPDVHDVVNRLWVDISRYGPGLPAFPEVRVPSLGDFQVPPPPPLPSSSSTSVLKLTGNWIRDHPKTVTAATISVVGVGLWAGRRRLPSINHSKRASVAQRGPTERRQVVVVLGGDTPHGLPLVLGLEKKGYIVIASVSTAEAADALESRSKGYVKALVLDPSEPATVPIFLRSLSSTLSRRFPLKSAGDPYISPSSQPYIQSVISLLSLPSSAANSLAPFEHLSLAADYLPYLQSTQITPLQVIQQLLPILRTGSARSRDKGHKTIIVCLPAIETRVSLPFSAVQAMSAAGTLKAVETLRREIQMAALTGKSEAMSSIKVVVVDVGSIDVGPKPTAVPQENLLKATETWTSSEKIIYGPAFASILHKQSPASVWDAVWGLFDANRRYSVSRRPAKASTFVDKIIATVSGGRHHGPSVFGYNIGLGYIRTWLRGDRFAVGAGAHTYMLASYLPSLLLDTLLNLPHLLIGLRNRLLPVEPFVRLRPDSLPKSRASPRQSPPTRRHILPPPTTDPEVPDVAESEFDAGSEPDSVASSWISLDSSSQPDVAVDSPDPASNAT
ncbi:hypothetical protein FA15DRAFT_663372 [Coprinopsis marcescibilis]|uniref:DUF1776-domain-containing protein n=1 Tax=Coprinopsis marcescibilis TaxID=230819 RepID=A0A5C3LBL6_COPMA|nr:hypothetical protein FA15DRAFT_663372 [Coprinopsis marcescibilis]